MPDIFQKHSCPAQHCCMLFATSRFLCQPDPSSCQNSTASIPVVMLMAQAAKANKSTQAETDFRLPSSRTWHCPVGCSATAA